MTDFVLVHGAWHGAWCWQRVATRLEAAGHRVHLPVLAGVGERAAELAPDNDLETHIGDVLAVMDQGGLRDVVLVGHSYGGMLISAVADRMAGRVGALVYVDAHVPGDGQSVLDMRPEAHNIVLREQVARHGDGWRMPPTPAVAFGVNQADRDWVDAMTTDMALACFEQPVALDGRQEEVERRTYVRATGFDSARFDANYRQALESPRWRAVALDCGHDIMLDDPDGLTAILLDAAGEPA